MTVRYGTTLFTASENRRKGTFPGCWSRETAFSWTVEARFRYSQGRRSRVRTFRRVDRAPSRRRSWHFSNNRMHPIVSRMYALIGASQAGRETNRPEEGVYRKDVAYERLTKIRYSDPIAFRKIDHAASVLEKANPENPSVTAYAAYCRALEGDWHGAVARMRETIRLEGGRNLDSWVDLGHFLRKLPEGKDESGSILLDPVSKVSE